jgi:cell division protein FtsW
MSTVRRIDEPRAARKFSWAGVWNSATTSYYLVLGATIALVVFGLIMVLSSSFVESLGRGRGAYYLFSRQAIFAVVGTIGLIVAMHVKISVYKRLAWLIVALSFALQMIVFIIPHDGGEVYGNKNWIPLPGGASIQPSEFMKLALAVFLGTVVARKLASAKDWLHVMIPTVPVVAVGIGLVMLGRDLGTVLVLIATVAGCYFVAGLPWRWIGTVAVVAGLGVAAATVLSENRFNRVLATYDSECTTADPLCFQVLRGLEGLGSGGLGGVGLGAGAEKWAYLPEAQNDFIFAVIGEEVGFLGTTLVVLLFGILGLAFVRIIMRHPDPMVKITTGGIAAWIIGQAVINMGVVTRLIPVIGVPLPLVSAGGSALVATMMALGVVLAFAKDEPGAREAFEAKPSVVRKTIAVISQSSSRLRSKN